MSLFAAFLKLEGRIALVIGGGKIAEEKVESLLFSDCSLRLVSPEITPRISTWVSERKVRLFRREFEPDDLEGVFLAIAATSTAEVNHFVYREAQLRGILCNVVDDPPYCDFYFPAVVRRGDLQIAISTNGQSPALAQRLRRELEQQFPPECAETVARIGEQRRSILATQPPGDERKALLHRIAQEALA
ncbi:MAG: bifunctional precorrin-2 dehydrogenase/sirohydrochlorin ferrochelatase [Bryobacteraceae bacterium]